MLSRIFKDCFSEDDNQTWDIDAFGYAIALISYVVLCGMNYNHFNALEVAGGFVAILSGRSVAETYRKSKGQKS